MVAAEGKGGLPPVEGMTPFQPGSAAFQADSFLQTAACGAELVVADGLFLAKMLQDRLSERMGYQLKSSSTCYQARHWEADVPT